MAVYGYEEGILGSADDPKLTVYKHRMEMASKKRLKNSKTIDKLHKKVPTVRRLKYESAASRDTYVGLYATVAPMGRRLKFDKQKLAEREYRQKLHGRNKAHARRRRLATLSYYDMFKKSDDNVKSTSEFVGGAVAYSSHQLRKNKRTIERYHNPYARIKSKKEYDTYQQNKSVHSKEKLDRHTYKQKLKAEKDRMQRQQLKKRMLENRKMQEGNWFRRTVRQFIRKKQSAAYVSKQIRKAISLTGAIFGIFVMMAAFFMIGIIAIVAIINGSAELYASAVIQADYNTMSDVTAYYRSLETDLEEVVSEENIKEAYPNCYEYIFNLAPIGHDPIKLMSYIATKYGEFTLDMVTDELHSIFEEMYMLTVEIKQEERMRPVTDENGIPLLDENGNPVMETFLVDICYITLEVKSLEEVLEGRLTEEEKKQYQSYLISSGGQQVYGPVMQEEWTGLISSPFGERIHPITGERTFHNGVDIAVPVGTKLYTVSKGTVITAAYSESAGNYIIVKNEEGWVTKYMHLDSMGIRVGDILEQGDYIGESGNTGRSTGPHLHLEVRNAEDKPVDPTFLVPSSCVIKERN